MARLLSRLPSPTKDALREARNRVLAITSYRGRDRYCPVCNKQSRKFRPYGIVKRDDAQCVHCGALERHRFLWLFLERNTDIFDTKQKRVLHVAPESCYEVRLKKQLGSAYLTSDLYSPSAMVKMDICDIHYDDESFDVIVCNHVLEHVPNDRMAMGELNRVLKKNGWAVLNVPITSDKTYEDPSIVTPQARLTAFGQEDHVRRYGPDYLERLRDTGFDVDVVFADSLVDEQLRVTMGLTRCGEIYYCRKAALPTS